MGTPAAATPPAEDEQPQPQQLVRASKSSATTSSSSHSSRTEVPQQQQQQQLAPPASLAPSTSTSNVTAEMRKRGATTSHRGSLPAAFDDVSSFAMLDISTNNNTNNSRRSRATKSSAGGVSGAAPVVLDRRLLQKYEEVNSEITRLTRLSRMEHDPVAAAALPVPASAPANESQTMLRQVTADLRKARRSSSQAIQSQKELLDKLERQEKSGFRRFFSLNKESKVEKIKSKLCDKLSESVQVDEELQRLERQSDALARTSLAASFNYGAGPPMMNASYSHTASYSTLSGLQSVAEVEDEIACLEREKEDILNNLFSAIKSPSVQELHQRIAMYSSEIHACQSIQKQVDRCATMYRQALHLLSVALATVVSPHYSGTVKEFVAGPYPLAIEASHLIEGAAHGIQPESRRRYHAYAPELVGLRPPKFPQAIADYARRARANVDPNSTLALEAMRKLRNAENVLMLLQRLVIEKSEVIDAWKKHVAQDQVQAERGHDSLEKRLHEQVAVLARSVSV